MAETHNSAHDKDGGALDLYTSCGNGAQVGLDNQLGRSCTALDKGDGLVRIAAGGNQRLRNGARFLTPIRITKVSMPAYFSQS